MFITLNINIKNISLKWWAEMSQEIEIEYKNLLTKEEFIRLLHAYPFPEKPEAQTNYYFDTENFELATHRYALRIRSKNNQFQLTLKQPHPDGILETHDRLTEEDFEAWMQGEPSSAQHVEKQINKIGISLKDMIFFGSLTTSRYETTDQEVTLVLDHSIYNGKEDYEFELEAPNQQVGSKKFQQILTTHGIITRDTPTKIERFFKTLPQETQVKLKPKA